MKHVRSRIELCLSEAGFTVDGKSEKTVPWSTWIEYATPNEILRCSYDLRRAHLTAESLEAAECRIVADVELGSVTTTELLFERLDRFADQIREFLKSERDELPHDGFS